ncbi:MAG: hypothetical protein ACYT04_28530 [Nostoc sp.]
MGSCYAQRLQELGIALFLEDNQDNQGDRTGSFSCPSFLKKWADEIYKKAGNGYGKIKHRTFGFEDSRQHLVKPLHAPYHSSYLGAAKRTAHSLGQSV